jgi:hypothetical protein
MVDQSIKASEFLPQLDGLPRGRDCTALGWRRTPADSSSWLPGELDCSAMAALPCGGVLPLQRAETGRQARPDLAAEAGRAAGGGSGARARRAGGGCGARCR